MPNHDKTGPAGQGPMTGKGVGCCAGKGQGASFYGRGFLKNSSVSLEDEEKFLENRLEVVRKLKTNSK